MSKFQKAIFVLLLILTSFLTSCISSISQNTQRERIEREKTRELENTKIQLENTKLEEEVKKFKLEQINACTDLCIKSYNIVEKYCEETSYENIDAKNQCIESKGFDDKMDCLRGCEADIDYYKEKTLNK